jgi:hypothetical protein
VDTENFTFLLSTTHNLLIGGLKGGKHGDCGLLDYDAVMLVAAGGTTLHHVAEDAILLKTNNIFTEVICGQNADGYRRYRQTDRQTDRQVQNKIPLAYFPSKIINQTR